jgi:hypothetical protein
MIFHIIGNREIALPILAYACDFTSEQSTAIFCYQLTQLDKQSKLAL